MSDLRLLENPLLAYSSRSLSPSSAILVAASGLAGLGPGGGHGVGGCRTWPSARPGNRKKYAHKP